MINNNNVPSLAIIEVWNNPMHRTKIREKLKSNITDHQNRNQNKGLLYIIGIFNFHIKLQIFNT